MIHTITQREIEQLDGLAVQADLLRMLQQALAETVCRHLAAADDGERMFLASWVDRGAAVDVETLLGDLSVVLVGEERSRAVGE